MDNIQIAGFLFRTLTVNRPGFFITNKFTNKALKLPTQLRISFLSARKSRCIFQQPFTAYILLVHHVFFMGSGTRALRKCLLNKLKLFLKVLAHGPGQYVEILVKYSV